ncbi:MAG: methyltransferase domain-containing protein [Ferruginibacter sp.]
MAATSGAGRQFKIFMGHLNSRLLWHKYAEQHFGKEDRVLEIGPQGYPSYYEQALQKKYDAPDYTVLDIRTNFISGAEQHPRFILSEDALHYPIEDNAFDIVFSDQVLAHVEYFWAWYGELIRITKKGGYIITINSYSYPSCPSPIDAWRVHSDGMKALNKYYNIETILSVTESAELAAFGIPEKTGYYFPGASVSKPYGGHSNKNLRINMVKKYWNKFAGLIPGFRSVAMNPSQVAFDTITIARKS